MPVRPGEEGGRLAQAPGGGDQGDEHQGGEPAGRHAHHDQHHGGGYPAEVEAQGPGLPQARGHRHLAGGPVLLDVVDRLGVEDQRHQGDQGQGGDEGLHREAAGLDVVGPQHQHGPHVQADHELAQAAVPVADGRRRVEEAAGDAQEAEGQGRPARAGGQVPAHQGAEAEGGPGAAAQAVGAEPPRLDHAAPAGEGRVALVHDVVEVVVGHVGAGVDRQATQQGQQGQPGVEVALPTRHQDAHQDRNDGDGLEVRAAGLVPGLQEKAPGAGPLSRRRHPLGRRPRGRGRARPGRARSLPRGRLGRAAFVRTMHPSIPPSRHGPWRGAAIPTAGPRSKPRPRPLL